MFSDSLLGNIVRGTLFGSLAVVFGAMAPGITVTLCCTLSAVLALINFVEASIRIGAVLFIYPMMWLGLVACIA